MSWKLGEENVSSGESSVGLGVWKVQVLTTPAGIRAG